MTEKITINAHVAYAYPGRTEEDSTIRILSGRGVVTGQDITTGNRTVWLVRVYESSCHAHGTIVSVLPRHVKRINGKH
jgi:hypothetical protein